MGLLAGGDGKNGGVGLRLGSEHCRPMPRWGQPAFAASYGMGIIPEGDGCECTSGRVFEMQAAPGLGPDFVRGMAAAGCRSGRDCRTVWPPAETLNRGLNFGAVVGAFVGTIIMGRLSGRRFECPFLALGPGATYGWKPGNGDRMPEKFRSD